MVEQILIVMVNFKWLLSSVDIERGKTNQWVTRTYKEDVLQAVAERIKLK